MTDPAFDYLPAAELAEHIRRGELTAVDAVEAALHRIDAFDAGLRAFSVVRREAALREAEAADAEGPSQDRPLHGIPVAIKEEVAVTGLPTTYGGRANPAPAAADAEVVRRLRAAGAIVIGKTNMPEFGQFPFTEGDWGMTANPWDRRRSPGGSSGGSAVAVASGMVPVAIGGDGGGSIRIPAAACGLFGLKAQRGRVSTSPSPDLWGILGTTGPLTRTVLDSALVHDVIHGATPLDRFRAASPTGSYVAAATTDPARLRIRWTTRPLVPGQHPSPEVAAAVEATAHKLAALGHDVAPGRVRVPSNPWAFPVLFYASVRAERAYVSRPELLERRTQQTMAIGRYVATPSRVAAAERAAAELEAAVVAQFDDCDLFLMPTMTTVAPPIGRLTGRSSMAAQLASVPMISYTSLWNLTGNPAASVPAGFDDATGLPLAVQLVAAPGREDTIFAAAGQLERAHPWADTHPAL